MNTDPFPHLVTRGDWRESVLDAARSEFDLIPPHMWQEFRNDREFKNAITFDSARRRGADVCWEIREYLASPTFVDRLAETVGIAGLEYDELGGGLHEIPPGGYLGMHVDFNRDDQGRYRRVNLLLYLNRDWRDDEGGALILAAPGRDAVAVAPEFNTQVIFVCSETSWHGHPIPVTSDRPRRSLAAYYFTSSPPPGPDVPAHDTIFLEG